MVDKIMTLLVGLLIALGGWSLSRTFELSTVQAVQEDKRKRTEDDLFNEIMKIEHKKQMELKENGSGKE